jgi:hypothetical protein
MLRDFRLLQIQNFFDNALYQRRILRTGYAHSILILAARATPPRHYSGRYSR